MRQRKAHRSQLPRDWLRLIAIVAMLVMASPAMAQADNKRLLLYGDSIMAGYGLDPADGFGAQLQAALDAKGPGIYVVNASVSGDTTASALDRLDWALADPVDAVIVELGANDMLQGLPTAEAEHNLDAILARFKRDGIPVLLVGMKANPTLGADYVASFDALYPSLSQKYGTTLMPFLLDGVALDPALNQDDEIHPNPAGVKVIVASILPYVEALLEHVKPN